MDQMVENAFLHFWGEFIALMSGSVGEVNGGLCPKPNLKASIGQLTMSEPSATWPFGVFPAPADGQCHEIARKLPKRTQ